jgi:hypothetical protein
MNNKTDVTKKLLSKRKNKTVEPYVAGSPYTAIPVGTAFVIG